VIVAGILTPIENVLTAALEWFHASLGLPWAWAIVVLTLVVRMLLVPLTVRQIHSMQNLQKHAPEMKAIQERYKNDKLKQREELMAFYKENSINPAASCLPILPQIPIFISLYFVLKDFEKEVFPQYPDSDLGWLGLVPNITQNINEHWSGWLLLVVYVVSQLASTYFMSTTMDPRQRYIFFALPFLFVFFVINFPIGLMLYWSTTNLWTVGQGLITRRLVPKPQPPPKRTSRTPPKTPQAGDEGAEAAASDETTAKPAGSGQQRVRRRKKKKGPRARR
jgi:YidC/Oxa1 family membrane protein insertase